jgi:hypothetical protein
MAFPAFWQKMINLKENTENDKILLLPNFPYLDDAFTLSGLANRRKQPERYTPFALKSVGIY